MKLFVSRQIYWGVDPENSNVVEVAIGGRDYANPDMLVPKFEGEGQEYINPIEAVEAALQIAEQWRRVQSDKTINVAYGNSLGFTMPFEPKDVAEIKAWAQKVYQTLPRCSQCGELLGEETYTLEGFSEEKFCREYCAEKFLEENTPMEEEIK